MIVEFTPIAGDVAGDERSWILVCFSQGLQCTRCGHELSQREAWATHGAPLFGGAGVKSLHMEIDPWDFLLDVSCGIDWKAVLLVVYSPGKFCQTTAAVTSVSPPICLRHGVRPPVRYL
jgi:hypothetical protein